MDLRVIGEWIDEQEWLETAAAVTQAGVKGFFNALGEARRPIKNFLNAHTHPDCDSEANADPDSERNPYTYTNTNGNA